MEHQTQGETVVETTMPIKPTLIVFAILCIVTDPERVFAWGPAVHIGLAEAVLEQLPLLPAAVAAILARHRLPYLYGNIAADVVFAKRLSRIKQSCHHWSTAFRLLDDAPDDRTRAFAFGYLSHLAADTVAHGKYVPRQILENECTVNFGHVYWELRSDAAEPNTTWQLLEQLLRQDHAQHHRVLAQHITDTFLSYRLNRLLFDGITRLTLERSFRRTMSLWSRHSRWYLSPALLDRYRGECLDRIFSILAEGVRSAVLRDDPNGTSALMNLRVRRKEIRRLRRRGLPTQLRTREASWSLAPQSRHDRQRAREEAVPC